MDPSSRATPLLRALSFYLFLSLKSGVPLYAQETATTSGTIRLKDTERLSVTTYTVRTGDSQKQWHNQTEGHRETTNHHLLHIYCSPHLSWHFSSLQRLGGKDCQFILHLRFYFFFLLFFFFFNMELSLRTLISLFMLGLIHRGPDMKKSDTCDPQ